MTEEVGTDSVGARGGSLGSACLARRLKAPFRVSVVLAQTVVPVGIDGLCQTLEKNN